MTEERFTSWGNSIERDGKLLNIEFKTKTDAKLCCKLCNQMDKHQQEYIDKLNEIFKWYKDYYGETILDTRMGWNDDNKISKLEKENEQLKAQLYCDSNEGVCIICKHHYVEKTNMFYISKCEKGHEECSKESVRHCEDFKLKELRE